jgi:superfamily II DNA or RNA helicase
MPTIYDNIDKSLREGLKRFIQPSDRLDCCVGYFNLRGWSALMDDVDKLSGGEAIEDDENVIRYCRVLVGMQKMPQDLIKTHYGKREELLIDNALAAKLRKRLAQEFKDQLSYGIPTNADEDTLRRLSDQLKSGRVVVKLFLRHQLHAKLYLTYEKNNVKAPITGLLGSSNLTFSGLTGQGELNVDVVDADAGLKLEKWFNDRWNDRWCLDISKELIDIIDNQSWASEKPIPPYHIYLKIAYHLSREARAGLNEFRLPRIFQTELLEFQQKAVLVAAHHLHRRGGVMIGDVVGLGKTITATALAKLFQDDFFLETLIICPPNLKEMWDEYRVHYGLNATVISAGNVSTELPAMRRYRLIIIDESHNQRNSEGKRYRAIKDYLERNESKVILLSATPYNKSYIDLSNQLRLFIPDDRDLGLTPENYIRQLGSQAEFTAKHTETFIRSIKAFEKSDYADDWRELMRLFLVRRTRSFIKTNYALFDPEANRHYLLFSDGSRSYFPDRIPKKVEYHFDPNDPNDQYAKLYSLGVVDILDHLDLPRYGLGNYLEKKPSVTPNDNEKAIITNLSRAGKRLMGFCRTNLFKRLESSGYSFLLSLSRHVLRNYLFIHAIENNLPLPVGKQIANFLDDFLEDDDIDGDDDENTLSLILSEDKYLGKAAEVYDLLQNSKLKKQFDWISSGLFSKNLKSSLLSDARNILKILNLGRDWNPDQDRQLNALYHLCANTHAQEKVLIFTQYADTAYYLEKQLTKRGLKKLACVTGNNEHPTALAHRFSPNSNKYGGLIKGDQELRILIATDVLSEGQNLQDSHIILNYDLPWALIRLIQRAGRVDRIGQQATQILCYSFLPEDGLENIIRLRARLQRRITENAEVVGSDEVFFEGDPVNLDDLYNEKSGILEDDDDGEVDLASYAYQIWKNATDADPRLLKLIPDLPNVVFSAKPNTGDKVDEGVILYARSADDNDILTWIGSDRRIITQSQLRILKSAACPADTPALPRSTDHHDLVAFGMDYIDQEERHTGGTLGRKSGIKYRVYTRLEHFYKQAENTLFSNEPLKKAVDEIYRYPFQEFARETLARQLKAGIADEDLAQLVVSLHEENKLCIVDEHATTGGEPQIICSLGLLNDVIA